MAPTPSEEIQPVQPKQRAIPLQNYLTDGVYYDTLYTEADRVNLVFIEKLFYVFLFILIPKYFECLLNLYFRISSQWDVRKRFVKEVL